MGYSPFALFPSGLLVSPETQSQFAIIRVQLDDFQCQFLTDLDHVLRSVHASLGQLGHVEQPLDAVGKLNEGPEIGNPNHLSRDIHADPISLRDNGLPGIGMGLLEPQRDAAGRLVHMEHDGLDAVPLFQNI